MRRLAALPRGAAVAAACVALLLGSGPGCRGAGEASALPRGRVTIEGRTVEVEIARTSAQRARGLSGRAGLPTGQGMLFLHEAPGLHTYWMKDMRFAIDILWLRDGRVVDVAHRVPPPPAGMPDAGLSHYGPREPADAVLEVPAGFARVHGWDVGARVSWELPPP